MEKLSRRLIKPAEEFPLGNRRRRPPRAGDPVCAVLHGIIVGIQNIARCVHILIADIHVAVGIPRIDIQADLLAGTVIPAGLISAGIHPVRIKNTDVEFVRPVRGLLWRRDQIRCQKKAHHLRKEPVAAFRIELPGIPLHQTKRQFFFRGRRRLDGAFQCAGIRESLLFQRLHNDRSLIAAGELHLDRALIFLREKLCDLGLDASACGLQCRTSHRIAHTLDIRRRRITIRTERRDLIHAGHLYISEKIIQGIADLFLGHGDRIRSRIGRPFAASANHAGQKSYDAAEADDLLPRAFHISVWT